MAEVDRVVADRRRFLKSAAGSCAAVAGIGTASVASSEIAMATREGRPPTTFSRAVDLTHTLRPDFPAWFSEGQDIMGRTAPASLTEVDEFVVDAETPFALKKVSYWEHVGTHVDAASHCSAGGKSVDEIPAEELVAPLAVLDIRKEAAEDPLAQVTPEHVRRWEAVNGPLPPGCFVAMNSGWSEKAGDRKAFLCPDESAEGLFTWQQPAFHPDTASMLLEDREEKIGDTHRSAPHIDSVLGDFGLRFTSGREVEVPDEGPTPREGTVGARRLGSRRRLMGVHDFRPKGWVVGMAGVSEMPPFRMT
jgi:kynurenine formamidase